MTPGLRIAWAAVSESEPRRDVAWRLLAELLPGATLSNVCDRCGGPHGPVRVSGVAARASVSYAAGYAVVATAPADEAAALGIDAAAVDAIGANDALGIRSVRTWTRIEAAVKADGRGLRVDAGSVRILPGDDGDWTAVVPGAAQPFTGWDAGGPDGVVVSAAVAVSAGSATAADPAAGSAAPDDRATP